jgi:hypothetical protein
MVAMADTPFGSVMLGNVQPAERAFSGGSAKRVLQIEWL